MLPTYLNYIIYILLIVLPAVPAMCQVNNVADKIIITNDIAYKKHLSFNHDTASLTLDVYSYSVRRSLKRAAIIFVHGGGFWEGDKRSGFYVKMATAFAMHGYAAISMNYTLKAKDQAFNGAIMDTCIADVMAAVRWVKIKAEQLGIDTSEIFICGDSAGGGIVINTSYHPLYRQNFIGCIDLWGGLPGKQGWEAPIFTGDFVKQLPASCIIHGTADRIVPFETSRRLSGKLTQAGVYHSLHPLEKADHYPVQMADRFIPIIISFADEVLKREANKKSLHPATILNQ